MTIGPTELARIAALAELDLEAADLERLAGQIDGIVEYVGHLAEALEAPAASADEVPEHSAPLRADLIDPIPMAAPPAEWAPEFRDGFFLVPRLAGMDE